MKIKMNGDIGTGIILLIIEAVFYSLSHGFINPEAARWPQAVLLVSAGSLPGTFDDDCLLFRNGTGGILHFYSRVLPVGYVHVGTEKLESSYWGTHWIGCFCLCTVRDAAAAADAIRKGDV